LVTRDAVTSKPHTSVSESASAILDARRQDLDALARERWDVLVVGGGITGCGVLLDAASRGLRAALIERDDIAVGTSSRSSRLIHGGLRYLEQFQIGLVREALRERSVLLRLAPHLVRLEPFLFPVYGGPWARPFFGAGLTMYDLLGASADGGFHRHLSVEETLAAVPGLRRTGLRGAFLYHDGQEDDARFAISVVRTARAHGALAVTRMRALRGIERDGRIVGCTVRDELTGSELDIQAVSIVDATGVWVGRADGPFPSAGQGLVQPSRGTHIVVQRDRIPSKYGLTLRIPHRVCFLVPWPDRWVIGTTDEEDHGSPDRPTPTLAEVDEILANVNGTFDVSLTRRDVMSAFAGLRPLATDPGGSPGSTVKASREHRIRTEPNGLVRISGGKFTTYRLMAAQTVDTAIGPVPAKARPSRTTEVPIIGAAPIADLNALAAEIARETGLDPYRAERIVARFGTQASDVIGLGRELGLLRPLGPNIAHLEAEVVWSVRKESALSVDDFLARRTRLAQELLDRGAMLAPRVAELMGAELGWSSAEQDEAVKAFLASAHREYDVPLEA
jgi:glycerol-3-phosphate dehydrogenase